ncbi:MAG: hypothetical protein V5A46_06025, partial [Haloferacaceae archaeon]
MGCTDRSRGQSAVVGYVLVIGLSLAVVGVVVTMGGMAITDVQESAQASQAETSMTEFDSRAAQVALGDSPRQSFRLGGDGDVSVDEDAGRIQVRWVNETDTELIADEDLGAVVYDSGDRRIAYQGGGVWRAENNRSRMVSPPEYHYRDRTLTFPIIRVTGNASGASSGDQIDLRKTGFDHHFPNENRSNPLEGGHVQVEVTSDYHHGWKTFFETRTQGNVDHDPANRTVLVNLTVPFSETFEHGVAATADGSDAIDDDSTSPHGGFDDGRTGVDRPSVSPQVEAAIDDCENGSCANLSSPVTGTLVNDTYYTDGDVELDALEYDTSGGDIDVVVDGDLTFSGDSHEITGDNGNVTFYVNGSVSVSGSTEVNTGGDPDDLLVLLHSEGGDIATASGTPQFTGYIYAPRSELVINGGGYTWNDNIVAADVVERA